MVAAVRLALVFGVLLLVAGCSSRRPPAIRASSAISDTSLAGGKGSSRPIQDLEEHAPDSVPKVVRRILVEQKELLTRSQAMAHELRDPHGRARAIAELDELARALARIDEAVTHATTESGRVDSDVLDAVVSDLLLLDTRISLQHEKLRTATERTSAVLVE